MPDKEGKKYNREQKVNSLYQEAKENQMGLYEEFLDFVKTWNVAFASHTKEAGSSTHYRSMDFYDLLL